MSPLYRFHCEPCGADSMVIRPLGTEAAPCRVCGDVVQRAPAFCTAFVVDPAPVPDDQKRYDLGLFQEAAAERDYYHRREEDRAQRELPSPSLWKQARRQASLVRSGQAPPPSGRR